MKKGGGRKLSVGAALLSLLSDEFSHIINKPETFVNKSFPPDPPSKNFHCDDTLLLNTLFAAMQ